jgi:acetylornithine aminotransferase
MPGYRSGFAAGDAELVAALKRYRPNVGTAPPTFVQRAAVIAWGDEEHVVETRERYGRKRDIILPALRGIGLEPAGGDASFFLWLRIGSTTHPTNGDAEAFALRLLDELGIVVAPGPFFGPGGEGHVRAALVPTIEECARAADLLGASSLTA